MSALTIELTAKSTEKPDFHNQAFCTGHMQRYYNIQECLTSLKRYRVETFLPVNPTQMKVLPRIHIKKKVRFKERHFFSSPALHWLVYEDSHSV